jgi:hypothetical protein
MEEACLGRCEKRRSRGICWSESSCGYPGRGDEAGEAMGCGGVHVLPSF